MWGQWEESGPLWYVGPDRLLTMAVPQAEREGRQSLLGRAVTSLDFILLFRKLCKGSEQGSGVLWLLLHSVLDLCFATQETVLRSLLAQGSAVHHWAPSRPLSLDPPEHESLIFSDKLAYLSILFEVACRIPYWHFSVEFVLAARCPMLFCSQVPVPSLCLSSAEFLLLCW